MCDFIFQSEYPYILDKSNCYYENISLTHLLRKWGQLYLLMIFLNQVELVYRRLK